MTRILHLADLHARQDWFEFAIQEGNNGNYDLICLAGDLLDLNAFRPVGDQVDTVLGFLKRFRRPTAIVSGNHDGLTGAEARLTHAAWLKEAKRSGLWIDGESFEVAGRIFRCIPWMKIPQAAAAGDIWVCHAPPGGCPTGITIGGISWGDFALGELCRQGNGPSLLLGGHVHEPVAHHVTVGRTVSLNPGHDSGFARPNHIILELERGRGFLRRATGEELVFPLHPRTSEETKP